MPRPSLTPRLYRRRRRLAVNGLRARHDRRGGGRERVEQMATVPRSQRITTHLPPTAAARVPIGERRASNLVAEGDARSRRAERVGAQRARGDLAAVVCGGGGGGVEADGGAQHT